MNEKGEKKSYYPRKPYSKKLGDSVDGALEDARKVIEAYCKVEGLDENHVDFAVALDWQEEKPIHVLTFKAETVDKAREIMFLLLKGNYPRGGISLRDNLSTKSFKGILDIDNYGGTWGVGMLTRTEEELNEWVDRNRGVISL